MPLKMQVFFSDFVTRILLVLAEQRQTLCVGLRAVIVVVVVVLSVVLQVVVAVLEAWSIERRTYVLNEVWSQIV